MVAHPDDGNPIEGCIGLPVAAAVEHDRGCERELAEELATTLDAGDLPDLSAMQALFGPDPAKLPTVHVQLASLHGYGALIGTGEAA